MRYTEPKILGTENAVRAIQSIGLADSMKPDWILQDSGVGTKPTSVNAYEADE